MQDKYLVVSYYVCTQYSLSCAQFCISLQDGWTALHSAVGDGQMDAVNILLRRIPDIITQTDSVSKQSFTLLCSGKQWLSG